MAPSRPKTKAKGKLAAIGKLGAASKKKPASKKQPPNPKAKLTVAEQIVKMKEKPKKDWIKADYIKYSELLEKMHAGVPTEEPTFPPSDDDEPTPLPTKPTRVGPSAAAKGAKGPIDPKPSPEARPAKVRFSGSEEYESSRVRKLEPPKVRFSGSEEYETFKRQVLIWEGKYEGKFSQLKLGAEVMEVLSDEALDAVFAHVPEKGERLDLIMAALDQRYGRKSMPKATSAVENFAKCVRGKRTLRSFLNEYTTLRAKAMAAGEQMCPVTSGTKLLKAAELSAALHTQILSQIAASGKISASGKHLPSYADVLELLEILAQTYEAQEAAKKEEKNAFAAWSESQRCRRPGRWQGRRQGQGRRQEQGRRKRERRWQRKREEQGRWQAAVREGRRQERQRRKRQGRRSSRPGWSERGLLGVPEAWLVPLRRVVQVFAWAGGKA